MAATVQPYILRKLRGRNGGAAENIEDSQFQELINWYAKDGILKRRKGTLPLSGIAYAGVLTGAQVFLPQGVGYQVLLGLEDGIGWLDG